jgi:hypothetical protein
MAGIIIQVIPAKVGIKVLKMVIKKLDTRLRGYDNNLCVSQSCRTSKYWYRVSIVPVKFPS